MDPNIQIIVGTGYLICALTLYTNSRILIPGRWVRLLGWFFGTFALMSFLFAGLKYISDINEANKIIVESQIPRQEIYQYITPTSYFIIEKIIGFITIGLSVLNNWLVLLATFELFGKNMKPEEKKDDSQESKNEKIGFLSTIYKIFKSIYDQVLVSFYHQVKRLPAIFKIWGTSALVISSAALVFPEDYKILRIASMIPDVLLSTASLFLMGIALSMNLFFLKRKLISYMCGIVFPWCVCTQLAIVIFNVTEILPNIASIEPYRASLYYISSAGNLFLFLAIYYLSYRGLEIFRYVRDTVNEVNYRRKPFLTGDSVSRAIGEGLHAESVTLYIRLPKVNAPEVLVIKWSKSAKHNNSREPLNDFPEIKKMFENELSEKKDEESLIKFIYTKLKFLFTNKLKTHQVRSRILYNGAIIGCLEAEMNEFAAEMTVVVQQLFHYAERISIIVQTHREAMALEEATYQCAKLQGNGLKNGSDTIVKITENIYKILSPLGIVITGDIGFRIKEYYISTPEYEANLKDIIDLHRRNFNKKTYMSKDKKLKVKSSALEVQIKESNEIEVQRPFGRMHLIIKKDEDDLASPTLGVYSQNRRAIAAVVSDSIVNSAGYYLNKNLNQLGLELSREPLSINHWFKTIEKSASEAELFWTVGTNPENMGEFLGKEEHIQLVKANWEVLTMQENKTLYANPVKDRYTHHIITLRLPQRNEMLLFGVQNPRFGFELSFESPWKLYLQRLGDLAAKVLTKLQAQQKHLENINYQVMLTTSITSATIMHQLINMMRERESGFSTLHEAILYGKLCAMDEDANMAMKKTAEYEKLIDDLSASSEKMLELTNAIIDFTRFSSERPCSLLKAAEDCENLFHSILTENGIEIKINLDPKYTIDAPFHIVALSLANLIGNAKDSLKACESDKRLIQIDAREEENSIVCIFTDNGNGIPMEIQHNIFDFGVTTKSNGTGWGLYLVKRSLVENGSHIELKLSKAGHTEFRLDFPKAVRI